MEERVDKNSGAIIFKRDKKAKLVEQKLSELERKLDDMTEKNKILESEVSKLKRDLKKLSKA